MNPAKNRPSATSLSCMGAATGPSRDSNSACHLKLEPSAVEEFSNQKESLQATAAFLITDGELSDAARERVEEAGVTVIAGQSLENLVVAYRGATWPPLRRPEEPLPFQKYIPWFVGISLVVIVALVLALISAELTIRPPDW